LKRPTSHARALGICLELALLSTPYYKNINLTGGKIANEISFARMKDRLEKAIPSVCMNRNNNIVNIL